MISESVREKYFESKLKKNSEDPMYLQLRHCFSAWINDCEAGSKFPSERELAIFLNVNRRTLSQALEPLLESGVLQRRGHKTFIENKDGIHAQIDIAPFMIFNPVKRPMKILLFEDHPLQKRFWEEIIDNFNRLLPEHELISVFAVCDYTDTCQYWDVIEKEEFDIAVLPVSYQWKKGIETHFLPVKPAVKQHLLSEEFLIESLSETSLLLRDYTYPYLFSFPKAKYLKPYHILKGRHVKTMTFDEMLSAALNEVPETIPLFNIYFDICRGIGVPKKFSEDIIREQCNLILDRLDLLRPKGNAFSVSSYHSNWKSDLSENVFCYQTLSNSFLYNDKTASEYEDVLLSKHNDCFLWGSCGSVAICKSSENHQEALSFTEYLLSEPIQNTIWSKLHCAPVRVSSLRTIDFTTAEEALKFLKGCRENPRVYPAPIGSAMLPYMEQYLDGTISREKIIESVLRFYA